MQKIVVVMEKAPHNFGAYSKNVEGIFGVGDTVGQTKKSIAEAIEILKDSGKEDGLSVPEELCGDYVVEYEYSWDCDESLLEYRDKLFRELVRISEGSPCGQISEQKV